MSTLATNNSALRRMVENLRLTFRRPPRRQVAALCYRKGKKGPEVLLVTSRNTKRWIIPKGWPMAEHSARKTARIEAFEEAGVIGKAGKTALGEFPSHKGLGNGFKVRTTITVYPLQVKEIAKQFPERGKRELVWLPIEEAAILCNEDGLRDLLLSEKVKRLLMEAK